MDTLELIWTRKYFGATATASELMQAIEQDGVSAYQHICWGLEDKDRGDDLATKKVAKETAIPAGRYEVQITWSERFQCMMPILLGVPFFRGIRIHWGVNKDHTEGCLLVGHAFDISKWALDRSKAAYDTIFAIIQQAELRGRKVFITIRRDT